MKKPGLSFKLNLSFAGPRFLPHVKPWGAAALLMALGLTGYGASLGARYVQASLEMGTSTSRIADLSRGLRQDKPDVDGLEAELEVKKQAWEQARAQVGRIETEDLLSVISTSAAQTRTTLVSITYGDIQTRSEGVLRFRTQPVTIVLLGTEADLYRFPLKAQEKSPGVIVETMRLTDIQGSPSAQVNLVFYLSPEIPPTPRPTPAPLLSR